MTTHDNSHKYMYTEISIPTHTERYKSTNAQA